MRTTLTDEFDVDYPIMSAGMGNGIATGELAGAVTAAGGLGCIGASGMTPDRLAREIDRARERTTGPILVDILLPYRAPPTRDAVEPPEPLPGPVQQLHEELESQGVQSPDYADVDINLHAEEEGRDHLAIALEKGVDGIAFGLYTPEWAVEQAQEHDTTVLSLIGRTRHAVAAVENGADYIIAQGTEGGGHTGDVSTLSLVPQVRAAVNVPVVAAGGIVTGAQVLAALALGAAGVWMGTRFVVTRESGADAVHKQGILDADSDTATVHSEAFDGLPLRGLENRLTEVWEDHEHELADYPVQRLLMYAIDDVASEAGADDYRVLPAGQGSSAIDDDSIPPAGTVVQQIGGELDAAYDRLGSVFDC